jgi:radical SAM superfamily enzyme YgiQ (UPF0313 family)
MAKRGSGKGSVIGKEHGRSWTHLRCDRPIPFATPVATRTGHGLVKDPVGFPHVVTLRCPEGTLAEAGKLRLMKAFSLAVESLREAGRCPVGEARIDLVVDPGSRGEPVCRRGPVFTLPASWVEGANESLAALREAVLALVERERDGIVQHRPPGGAAGRGGRAKVLLFRNIFTKDVDSGDALQVNPGVHYLISSLMRAGVSLVLLDAKIPLQDVCRTPPDVSATLAPREFIGDPGELERALDEHPDLDLVCLTLLERSFGQVRHLCRFVRDRSRALIAVGGVFPTVTPEHCFAHLPEADIIVRGDGERVLPEIVRVVAGRSDGLDVEPLGRLEGVLARSGDLSISSRIDRTNRVMDLDASVLDFSFLERENVENGLSLSTSRGCIYSCRFCSVMDKKLWRARSVRAVMADLEAYGRRLEEIYGSADRVPASARRLQIWDDDFFLEPRRAAELLGRMTGAGFTTTFLQGTVSSFYRKEGRRITRELDEELLDSIPRDFFTKVGGLKIGTENFCDRELGRLGKPYDYERIRGLVLALARRRLGQDHYMILCNRRTTLDDLLENIEKITELRWAAGASFSVLEPSWLINLFPTALYRSCQLSGTELDQPNAGILSEEGYPELDYPLVIPERPERREVFEIARRFPSGMHFGAAGRPDWVFEGVYDPDDADYLRVFDHVRKVLLERRDRTDDPGERFRVEEALATRLSGKRWLPAGVLARVAPGLDIVPSALESSLRLVRYLERVLGGMGCTLDPVPEGIRIELEGVEFLVQRWAEGVPCAFHTRNLAFVVRSAMDSESRRQAVGPIIERLREVATRNDDEELE